MPLTGLFPIFTMEQGGASGTILTVIQNLEVEYSVVNSYEVEYSVVEQYDVEYESISEVGP
jgi:hypothetical protein